jgi:hypothetical protein
MQTCDYTECDIGCIAPIYHRANSGIGCIARNVVKVKHRPVLEGIGLFDWFI